MSEEEVGLEVEVKGTTCDLERHTFFFFRNGFPGLKQREEEERGTQDFIFLQERILPAFGGEDGVYRKGGVVVLWSAFAFSETDTKWFYTPTRYAGLLLLLCFCSFSVFWPEGDDSEGLFFLPYENVLVNYFCCRDLNSS